MGAYDHYWYGAIHKNTDNIHVHLSSVELSPSREIQEKNGVKNPRGKLKPQTLNAMKSTYGKSLLNWSEVYHRIGVLREKTRNLPSVYDKLDQNIFGKSAYQKEMMNVFIELDKKLPENWESINQYNNVIGYSTLDNEQQSLVDQGIEVIKRYNDDCRNQLEAWEEQLDEHQKNLVKTFGESENLQKDFKKSRQEDMQSRLGNALLKQFAVKKKDNQKEMNLKQDKESKNQWKYNVVERYLYKLDKQDEYKV